MNVEAQSVTDSLPDQLINPEEYEPLLPHCREKHNRWLTENKEPATEAPAHTYYLLLML